MNCKLQRSNRKSVTKKSKSRYVHGIKLLTSSYKWNIDKFCLDIQLDLLSQIRHQIFRKINNLLEAQEHLWILFRIEHCLKNRPKYVEAQLFKKIVQSTFKHKHSCVWWYHGCKQYNYNLEYNGNHYLVQVRHRNRDSNWPILLADSSY